MTLSLRTGEAGRDDGREEGRETGREWGEVGVTGVCVPVGVLLERDVYPVAGPESAATRSYT
jgi:hypothetical protein